MDNVVINQLDAAVAELLPDVTYKQDFGRVYRGKFRFSTSIVPSIDASLVDVAVAKVGAASGLTRGVVEAVDMTGKVEGWGEQFWYDGGFGISSRGGGHFAAPGDSGALVVRESDGFILGVIVALSSALAIACPIGRVLEMLGCSILPG
jgi:hypothetical protein